MSVINRSASPTCTLASVNRKESQERLSILYAEDASSVVSVWEKEQELERERSTYGQTLTSKGIPCPRFDFGAEWDLAHFSRELVNDQTTDKNKRWMGLHPLYSQAIRMEPTEVFLDRPSADSWLFTHTWASRHWCLSPNGGGVLLLKRRVGTETVETVQAQGLLW